MIVADANVILYALTPGERTSSAREALEGADGVAVPRLWRLEVANALAVMVRRRLLTRKEATQAGFPGHERPQKVLVLPNGLSEETGTLTRGTKKVAYKQVVEQHREMIEETYST